MTADRRLLAALGLGAVSVLVGLGASSLFVDENYSWLDANGAFREVQDHVLQDEVAPATYFLGLNLWIELFGDAEWVMRLPSALAAILLVGAVAWVAELAAGRTAAILAAGLAALSPLVLQYGQQARGYVFAMLAVTLAVGCALELERCAPNARRFWLAATLLASVAAFWIHYTSALVVFPLLAWLATRGPMLSRRARLWGVGGAALACAALLGQLSDQIDKHPAGLEGLAGLTGLNLAKVAGSPFDGRHVEPGGAPLLKLAAILCAIAIVMLLRDRSRGWAGSRGIALLAAIPPLVMIVRGAGGTDVVTSRYVAVAAPLMIVALAVWADRLPARWRAAVAGFLLLVALAGNVRSHLPGGHDADYRAALRHVAAGRGPSDAVVVSPRVGLVAIAYYAQHELGSRTRPVDAGSPDARRSARAAPGGWLITHESGDVPVAQLARSLGFRPAARRVFDANGAVVVTRLVR